MDPESSGRRLPNTIKGAASFAAPEYVKYITFILSDSSLDADEETTK